MRAPDELSRLFGEGTLAGLTDGQLLERYVEQGDGEAFAAIVARHGAMVLSVCRSSLGPLDASNAEDVFQATFLVLARRAGSIAVQGSLAGWLYRVARRTARQARNEAIRRRNRERAAAGREETPPHDPSRSELAGIVHQELARLPERYRMAVLLCDLHGLTRDQAAEAIGCPSGTVAGRLARGRERLRDRLIRRGVDPAVAWPAATISAIDRAGWIRRATVAILSADRGASVVRTAAIAWGRVVASVVLVIAIGAAGAAGLRSGEDPPPPAGVIAPSPPAPIDPEDPATAGLFAGKVVDTEGRPIAVARIHIAPRILHPREADPTDPGPVRAITGADGRFRFTAKDMTFTAIDGLPARRPGFLIATADGYGPDWARTWGRGESIRSLSDPGSQPEPTLILPRDDVPIRGRLLRPNGRPLAGATVRLTGLYVPWKRDLDGHLGKLQMLNNAMLSIDYDRMLETPGALPGLANPIVTDADGRFRLAGLGRERLVNLRISGPGIAGASIQVMTREAADFRYRFMGSTEDSLLQGASFSLVTKPGRTITGVVRDKSTDEPISDVWVGPGVDAITALETGRYPTTADARGRFTLDGLSPDLIEAHYNELTGVNTWRSEKVVLAVPRPGQPYFLAKGTVNAAGEAVVKCPRGIPFRLTVRDRSGRLVEAEVSYAPVLPSSAFWEQIDRLQVQAGFPLSRAARQADGSYRGVALPGPGAVLVEASHKADYRPACVDPRAFFAPGKADRAQAEAYGTDEVLMIATFYDGPMIPQRDYSAIVLINPAEGGRTMELSATVFPDRPRRVSLVDDEGRPVVGARMSEPSGISRGGEVVLRTSIFSIPGLHPDRPRRFRIVQEDRKLIGLLAIRGSDEAPCTVRMRPWGTLTGRIVDHRGRPIVGKVGIYGPLELRDASGAGAQIDSEGRFRIDRLVPGLSYEVRLTDQEFALLSGRVLSDVKVAPGRVRDLGDLRIPESRHKPFR